MENSAPTPRQSVAPHGDAPGFQGEVELPDDGDQPEVQGLSHPRRQVGLGRQGGAAAEPVAVVLDKTEECLDRAGRKRVAGRYPRQFCGVGLGRVLVESVAPRKADGTSGALFLWKVDRYY